MHLFLYKNLFLYLNYFFKKQVWSNSSMLHSWPCKNNYFLMSSIVCSIWKKKSVLFSDSPTHCCNIHSKVEMNKSTG